MISTTDIIHTLTPPLRLKPGQRQTWGNLQGSSSALILSQLSQQHPLLVVTADSLSAYRLLREIQFFAEKNLPVHTFPDWETLPYDLFSPHQDIISERLATLYQLAELTTGVLILPVTTLMHYLPPTGYVRANSLFLRSGQALPLEKFRRQLEQNGYRCVSQVMEHGEFAVRGSLVDLFPMGSEKPYRIDLFDNEIDTLRCFDPETQRSQGIIKEIRLLPAREFPLDESAIDRFRYQWRTHFPGDPTSSPIYRDVSTGLTPAGIEYYLPLFFEKLQTLFDYLPQTSVVVTLPGVLETAEQFWQEITERYQQLQHDKERPLLPPTELFLQANQIMGNFQRYPHLRLTSQAPPESIHFSTFPPPQWSVDSRALQPLSPLKQFLQNFLGRVLITAETLGRREVVLELLKNHGLSPTLVENWPDFLQRDEPLTLTVAPLEQGLILDFKDNQSIAIVSETQLFGERVAQRRFRKKSAARDPDTIIRNLTEMSIGAPVVHEEHGVGRYRGLITLQVDGILGEFLHLEYANRDKLYVPVASLQLISRFTGVDPEFAPLHRLGSNQWERAKRKAAQQVRDVAVELLDIYARRAARRGHAFKSDFIGYQTFSATFPFEETPDQQETIHSVLADMTSERPMDRLVCGDVGFGKTEVAMRAAFVAVQDGQQVAMLVPTTLLVQQHQQNFQDRFAEWPIRIEQLSRFRSKKEQAETLTAVAHGHVDIVIGTHKLLQDNVQFKRLGLVIIDEEHRFGVRQKERFKALRAEVDVLTLTATPIPRSLSMALSHLRDLSIIATPPAQRLAIKTFVREWNVPTLAEAILRELRRGGQVYFLHNDIDTIEKIAAEIRQWIPIAHVQVAHGKMRERELERVMQDFYHRRFNVLVCTTIIESGIDVPSANTIIINRADKLGLAQLYQLRGRVGRSHHRAYAYLIVPPQKQMTPDALKRIEAVSSLEELGIGFTLATHDLEIRGAGELLGAEQSGHVQEIGYTLYTDLLERAITALKEGRNPELEAPLTRGTEINLHCSALLPSDYLPDVHIRLILYKRIANAPDVQKLDEIQVEMIDRFGLLPEPAKALLKITELKLQATPLGIQKIDLGDEGGYVLFVEQPHVDPQAIVRLIQLRPHQYRLENQRKLRLLWETADFPSRFEKLSKFLSYLTPPR